MTEDDPRLSQHLPPGGNAASHRLLVVDDDDLVCTVVRRVAELEGFAAATAANGREALQRMASEAFDVILTDLYMPDHDGLELIRLLRLRRPAPLIIAMSGGGRFNLGLLDAAALLGAAHVLAKPFEVEHLRQLLRRAVNRAA